MLRALRLHALGTEPGVFSATFAEASTREESWWRKLASNLLGGQQLFGLFNDELLIGITAAFTYGGDQTGRTAILAMSYLLPEYRGQGLSRLFYEARIRWVRSNPNFEVIRVSHRRSNERSRRANQRHGFIEVESLPAIWPDGTAEDEVVYELSVSRGLP